MHTRPLLSFTLAGALFGCHAAAPLAAKHAALATASAPRREWCDTFRITPRGPVCLQPSSAEEQQHRFGTGLFEYQGERVVRRTRSNGRGGLEPDDDQCTEYRYRYEHDELVEGVGYRADGTVCDRALYAEHASYVKLVDAWGRPSVSRDRLYTEERLDRDATGFILRSRLFGRDGSPVPAPNGAYENRSTPDARGLEARICYFDQHGAPLLTHMGTHCIRYERDAKGHPIAEHYLGLAGEPLENVDGAERKEFEYDAFGNLTRRRTLHEDGRPIVADTGQCPEQWFHYDEHGFRTGSDCGDGLGHGARWREGNSSWRGTPDERGHTREQRYFDPEGNPMLYGSTRHARVELDQDSQLHVTERRYFLPNGARGQQRGAAVTRYAYNSRGLETKRSYFDASDEPTQYRGCASLETEYDDFEQAVRHTCRGVAGKPALNWDHVAVEEWRYDDQGRLVEERDFGADGKPAQRVDRVVREVYTQNASGTQTTTVHYAADGSVVHLPRFSFLTVRVAQPEAYWPPRTREASLARIEAARSQLLAGTPLIDVLYRYNDDELSETHPGDLGYDDPARMYSSARAALESLKVGEYSQVVEVPYGFLLYLRTE